MILTAAATVQVLLQPHVFRNYDTPTPKEFTECAIAHYTLFPDAAEESWLRSALTRPSAVKPWGEHVRIVLLSDAQNLADIEKIEALVAIKVRENLTLANWQEWPQDLVVCVS